MASNTLTGLIPTFYQALSIVSREMTGFIPAVARNTSAQRAAVNQTIRIPVAPAISSSTSITASNVSPDSGGQTASYVDMTISRSEMVPISWTGEEQLSVGSNGVYNVLLADQFAEAMRYLVNYVESDLAALYVAASRAYGTAASTPFSSSVADAAQIKKILDDNGCPQANRSLVINTTAGVNMRSLANLNSQYAAGTDATLRQGTLLSLMGLDIKESAQVKSHTAGGGTGYDIVSAGELVGQTTLALEAGTVNTTGIKAGDVITFAGGAASDSNKYVVTTGLTNTSGNIVIADPGLLVAKDTSDELTIGGNYTANLAFHRDAIQLITRAPQMPIGGDSADDVIEITDPLTGIAFQVCLYRQYKQVHYEVGLAWGVKAIKPRHMAILLG